MTPVAAFGDGTDKWMSFVAVVVVVCKQQQILVAVVVVLMFLLRLGNSFADFATLFFPVLRIHFVILLRCFNALTK